MTDADAINVLLFVARVVGGITLFMHGYQKRFMGGRIQGTAGWFESLGMRPGRLHAHLASLTEISCGIAFALGLITPLAAAGFVGIMVVAAWTHKDKYFIFKDGWEYNLVLGVYAVLIATIGPGEWSIDHALDIAEDLSGTDGLLISLIGLPASIGLLAVYWRPPVQNDSA